ncbi:hypothetical protein [Methylorubrum extorquens]|uniref:Uncharacterized protein n=2 Tax=Methylorubrum extorquens TaxID=408 RepID=C5B5N4_METEA|nr:hypothetical protein [Methylorubrum extorquens]ACS43766.1 Hypothetical protein MexAM1_META2p0972 [Methylorubrum extorquens AM1]EHP94487.1 hypothetical protein MetexDRAFT_0686 [Methylorubrum extorquens DSM 13060]MCP1546394.1 hypothetical protein [Methylorubrum extorquens]MCP1591061.1 hypothetical protein [Methylorubrum extorquens]
MRRLARHLYRIHLFGWQGALLLAGLTPPLAVLLLLPWAAEPAWAALQTVFILDALAYACFAVPLCLLAWLPFDGPQVDDAVDAG